MTEQHFDDQSTFATDTNLITVTKESGSDDKGFYAYFNGNRAGNAGTATNWGRMTINLMFGRS